ncbi:MAG: hypothetical protein GY869_07530 [Planctomycetes bacterium]|nr:hypothetical protein [Planctomycetota bacterium]
MKKNSILIKIVVPALMLCMSLLSIGCEQSNELTLRLKKGLLYRQKVHLTSDLVMPPFPGADYHDSELVLKYQVNDVDPRGVTTLRITIESIKASMRSLTVAAAYDSSIPPVDANAGGNQNVTRKYHECFQGLQGAGFNARLDVDGHVIDLFDLDPPLERVSSGKIIDEQIGGYQVAHLFSPTHLRQYVALDMFQAWASKQPTTGQNWISFEPAETPRALPVMVQKTYKINEIKNENGDRVAVVLFETVGALDHDLPDFTQLTGSRAQGEINITAINGTGGQVHFSFKHGRLIKLEEKIVAEIAFSNIQTRQSNNANQTSRSDRKIYYNVDKTIEYLEK